MHQETEWWVHEGDAWWARNREKVADPQRIARDPTLRMIARHADTIWTVPPDERRALEVGCASGWRLEEIRRAYGAFCNGCDPSAEAVMEGNRLYPDIDLHEGMASDLGDWGVNFHCVILAWVCHWIDRHYLAKSVAEIDRVLRPGGHLVIADFAPDVPTKVRYHHRQDVEMWTYKLPWAGADLWIATGCYRQIETMMFNHDTGLEGDAPPEQRAACVLLQKADAYQ